MNPTYPTKCAYVEPKSGRVYAPDVNLHRPTEASAVVVSAVVKRRKLNLKAKIESGSSHFSFKR